MIDRTDVLAARERIAGRVRCTPVFSVAFPTLPVPEPVILKLEHLQVTGSFKIRGAFNRVLAAAERREIGPAGLIAASGGNAGLAVAHVAGQLDIPVTVYVPETAPAVKVDRLRALGASVIARGGAYAEAYEAATKRAVELGALFVHPYDQADVVSGQGTLALELAEQTGDALDTVLVAVGGGGLVAGVGAALPDHVRVVAVEPERCPTLHTALRLGHPVDVPVGGVAADALGARRIGDIAFEVATGRTVRPVLVSDEAISAARRLLWAETRLVVEHGAATSLAALLSGAYVPARNERVAVILCGANTDPHTL